MGKKELKWNIDKDKLKDPGACKVKKNFDQARSQMKLATNHHELYGLLAKNKSIHEWSVRKGKTKYFSEGSTQSILRKVLSDTIQRMPDGELSTQYDEQSKERILCDYIFENKVMWSENEGIDMLSNIQMAFKMSFIYAFAPVRTGFEKDYNGETVVSFNLEQWSDVFVNPDCRDIRRPAVVYHRQYLSKDDVLELLDKEGNVRDHTYQEDTIKYVIDNEMFTGRQWESEKMADKMKGSTGIQSLELVTEYRRGASEFVTYVPALDAVFRRVPNYDPRKGIPWNFLVLEPDSDFPCGVSQVEFLLADQQFNDLFQTSAYKNLLLAMEPPIMVSGWETNPSSYRYAPRAIWNLGNNPNNVKVEPVKIENSVLSGWATTREAVAASMMRNLNVMDGTIAKDSGTTFSKTAPGVKAQVEAKTININNYQKRVETFMGQWAAQAMRMYLNAMGGVHELTVDEETRRKLFDIGEDMLIDGNKVTIDFDELSAEAVDFKVRTGSLVQRKEDEELQKVTEMLQPIMQNLNAWSEQNRSIIENEVLLPITRRMVELSGTDISGTLSDSLTQHILENALAPMQQQMDEMQMQQMGQQQQIDQMQQVMPQQVPQEMQQPMQMPPAEALPMEGEMPSAPLPEEEIPGQQVDDFESMMYL